jgi:hypothetical protein
MAPSPALPAASTPLYSPPTTTTMGGGYLSTAPHGRSANGSMAPTPAHHGAETPSSSLACPPSLAQLAPSHPQWSMGGSQEGLMAPLPTQSGATKPLTSLAMPSVPACSTMTTQSLSSPSPPLLKGGGASLAEHRATTVLQCWKRRIWLHCWFAQQTKLKQKRVCIQTLCHGASTYASLVGITRRQPPTPTNKLSNPKVLHHSFRTHGQPLPPWKRA